MVKRIELKKELRECDGLLSEVWINTVQYSEELICNIFRRPKGEEGIANSSKFKQIQANSSKFKQIQANSSKFKQSQANSSKVKQIQVPKKYVPPFVGKIFLLTKGRQCLNKWASPLITEILLLQSFT
jgi:hypothetical protein